MPKKRPKLCPQRPSVSVTATAASTLALTAPGEGSLDHVVPRSRGGKDAWENLVWSANEVNRKKPIACRTKPT